ncbi:MAG: hypothetical protein HY716_03835 [Planctomycetes bacterium]|nr:hypothetical protein [Planctomycetota bacterium]
MVAPINADGSVGTSSTSTVLPFARGYHSTVVNNGFIYVTGGYDESLAPMSDILVAAIDSDVGDTNQTPDRLRGAYSHLVDLQSDTSTQSIILNGQTSPGGSVRLQVRVAPDTTKVFGEETVVDPAPLGSTIEVSGTARYVWIRVTLDDTATIDTNAATYVSDITVSGTPIVNVGSSGGSSSSGGCGSVGLDALRPMIALWLLRRRPAVDWRSDATPGRRTSSS